MLALAVFILYNTLVLHVSGVTLLAVGSFYANTTQLIEFDSKTLSMTIIATYSNTLIWDGGIGTCDYDRSRGLAYFVNGGDEFIQVSTSNGTIMNRIKAALGGIYELGVNQNTGDVFVVGPPQNYDPVSRTLGIYKLDFTKGLISVGTVANGLGQGIVELATYSTKMNTFFFQPFSSSIIIGYNTQINMPMGSFLNLNYTQIACSSDEYIFGFNGQDGDMKDTVVGINTKTYEVKPYLNMTPYYYSVPPGATFDKSSSTLYFYAFQFSNLGNTYLLAVNTQSRKLKAMNIPWANWAQGGLSMQNVWIK